MSVNGVLSRSVQESHASSGSPLAPMGPVGPAGPVPPAFPTTRRLISHGIALNAAADHTEWTHACCSHSCHPREPGNALRTGAACHVQSPFKRNSVLCVGRCSKPYKVGTAGSGAKRMGGGERVHQGNPCRQWHLQAHMTASESGQRKDAVMLD